MNEIKNPIAKSIILLLKKEREIPLGKIVENIEEPYYTILDNLIDLKSKGIVSKAVGSGYFKLTQKNMNK